MTHNTLAQAFPTLVLKVQNYTHTDGTYVAISTCTATRLTCPQICITLCFDAADQCRVVPLFVAEGTLPMFYQARSLPLAGRYIESCDAHLTVGALQGVKYNIPIAVWLPEKYPRVPPIMYVVPTHDMMIKPRHTFVTPSGVVNSEYVQHWKFPR